MTKLLPVEVAMEDEALDLATVAEIVAAAAAAAAVETVEAAEKVLEAGDAEAAGAKNHFHSQYTLCADSPHAHCASAAIFRISFSVSSAGHVHRDKTRKR